MGHEYPSKSGRLAKSRFKIKDGIYSIIKHVKCVQHRSGDVASRRGSGLLLLIVRRQCYRSFVAVSARRSRQQQLTGLDAYTSPRSAAKTQPA